MADTNNSVTDGSLSWDSMPFRVRVGDAFKNLNQVIAYRSAMFDNTTSRGSVKGGAAGNLEGAIVTNKNLFVDRTTTNDSNDAYDKVKDEIKETFGFEGEGDIYDVPVMRPYFRDTRVGGNDAINCLWQFNRDDDIMHPVNTIVSENDGCVGLGRVYSSTTEQNQQICWITFGIPYYTKMAEFYLNAFDNDLIALNQNGYLDSTDPTSKLAGIFGSGIGMAISLFTLPVKWAVQGINATRDQYPVNRFYELRGMMPLYYKYVDSILAQWLVSSGVYDQGPTDSSNSSSWTANPDYLPDALKATGVSIHDLTKRRALNAYLGQAGVEEFDTEDDNEKRNKFLTTKPTEASSTSSSNATKIAKNYDPTAAEKIANVIAGKTSTSSSGDSFETDGYIDMYSGWTDSFVGNMLGSSQFLGFRINKDVDASESFSNSTSPSSFAETFNSQVKEAAMKSADAGLKGGTGFDFVDSVIKAGGNLVSSALKVMADNSVFNLTGLSAAVTTGAYIDVPEQYSGSDFNKSHSISFQLRSPYGDMVSIYQSIIVPLACILAGALPRQAGSNSYNQPFLCRVYCKGMFSIPMGIIDSISIKRGSSEFGWTYNNLPTCVDVSISIKDMSPVMYVGLLEPGWTDLLTVDNSFKEYLLTLSGTGLFERISVMARLRRNMQFKAHKLRNYYFNPAFWSHEVSQWAPCRVVAAIIPRTTISTN